MLASSLKQPTYVVDFVLRAEAVVVAASDEGDGDAAEDAAGVVEVVGTAEEVDVETMLGEAAAEDALEAGTDDTELTGADETTDEVDTTELVAEDEAEETTTADDAADEVDAIDEDDEADEDEATDEDDATDEDEATDEEETTTEADDTAALDDEAGEADATLTALDADV